MSKRGISPLIATVLIIGFTIALAAIVMTWGGGFVRSTTEKTESSADMALKCSTELDFEIKSVSADDNKISVDNRGGVGIKALKLRFYAGETMISEADGGLFDYAEPIGAYAIATITPAEGLAIPATADKVDAIVTIDDGSGGEYVCGQSPREKSFTVAGGE